MRRARFHIPDDRDILYTVIHYPAGEIQVRLTKEGVETLDKKDVYEIKANRRVTTGGKHEISTGTLVSSYYLDWRPSRFVSLHLHPLRRTMRSP